MLKLQCADILHTLRHKPVMIASPPNGEPVVFDAKDSLRQKILKPLISKIHKSKKFIFDSGSDQDPKTVMAVRETAFNMLEAGLFHQSFPTLWIEDPFTDFPDETRNFYLTEEDEKDKMIRLWFISKFDAKFMSAMLGRNIGKMPGLCIHPMPLEIDLANPDDKFAVANVKYVSPMYAKILAESIYSYKKFIVTLNTSNLVMDKISEPLVGNKNWDGNPKTRPYEHTIISVPLEDHSSHGGSGNRTNHPKRKQLIRGYVWGKNTRPLSEQKWIKPYWRNENEVEIVEQTHYTVR